ncbi:MAG: GNAT family N-acetyltransferase [Streptosporangiales bacterium]|jgi:RimJ/RimL family protein N-acetyltransferase|nr:GNAT family N-acetyltransferase [Streptosporangiales bacterium]
MSQEPLHVVGALVKDGRNRVYVHHRTADRGLLPGTWDIVGGHVEPGETREAALERELKEETGWRLRRIETVLAEWDWEIGGVTRHETDYLIEVDGDLAAPVLEEGKHDASAWVGPEDLALLMVGRDDGDRRLRDVVARALRTRVTSRLLLVPMGPSNADDLRELHADESVAAWYGGPYTAEEAAGKAAHGAQRWESDGTYRWMARERDGGPVVGRGGVALSHVDNADRYEVSWTVRGQYRGKGYAAEIGAAGLAYAFNDLGASEVVSFAQPGNQGSRAVAESLGMRYDRDIILYDDVYVLYEITRGEFRQRPRVS